MEHKYLTATDLASYYHLACQLSLWNAFHKGHKPNKNPHRVSSLRKATFARGNEWEETLVERLETQNLIFRFNPNDSFQSQVESDPRMHFYVIGASFKIEDLFADEFWARGTSPVAFGSFKPDFIEISKRVKNGKLQFEWVVIDAKSSKAVKVYTLPAL